jgi:magnesium-transporting ATPase (P-type)
MAQAKVIVKRLASIDNFGSMNVICSDKTGTLTEGSVHLQSALDVEGTPSDQVLLYAYLNAFYETGFTNPIDEAIRTHRQFDLAGYRKADEIPYDFLRKRLSILVAHDDTYLMVTKGRAGERARRLCIGGSWRGNQHRYRRGAGPNPAAFRGIQSSGLSYAGCCVQKYGG